MRRKRIAGDLSPESQAIIDQALRLLESRMRAPGHDCLSTPLAVKQYLRLKLGPKVDHETFAVVLLDSQNRPLEYVELFRGTLTHVAAYPRDVLKLALQHNAAALILAHNHPSGLAEPSRADELITKQIKQVCALVDIALLDHIIICGDAAMSMAERGLI